MRKSLLGTVELHYLIGTAIKLHVADRIIVSMIATTINLLIGKLTSSSYFENFTYLIRGNDDRGTIVPYFLYLSADILWRKDTQ